MRNIKFLLSILLIFLFHGVFSWLVNRPQEAGPDVPAGKLMSLSFAPFREGFSPLEEIPPLREHIEEDISLLADKTLSIRTYSSLGGMEPTPEIAGRHGLKMIQGCWLGPVSKLNRKEIEALIQSANAHPDVVKRVIVGNEVLLRGDMDADRLIGYIREVKRAVKQPVSYADVWSMYMKYPKLIDEVDFITIHILPYWEDEPISVENATEHLEQVVRQVEDEARGLAPGKPILIGESGWPGSGRQRGMAIPGVVNEAKFIRGMIQVVNRHGFDYNIVEAFNQPWKSSLEGVVGANWGLYTADRKAVFPLTGKVSEDPEWLIHFFEATIIWLLIGAAYFKKIQSCPPSRALLFLILAQIYCICLVAMANYLWYTSYNDWQRGYTVFMILANGYLGHLLMRRTLAILTDARDELKLAERIRSLYLFFILLALYKTYGLAVNGRYLGFPIEQFAIAALGVFGLAVCMCLTRRRFYAHLFSLDELLGWKLHGYHDRFIAYFLSFGIIAMVLGEVLSFLNGRDFIQAHPGFSVGLPFAFKYTLYNRQLLAWLATLFALSIPFWSNTEQKSESTPSGAIKRN